MKKFLKSKKKTAGFQGETFLMNQANPMQKQCVKRIVHDLETVIG